MIDNLEQLAGILERMKPGERLDILGGYRRLWPRPPFYESDDYLSCEQRARNWCANFKCTVMEPLEPHNVLRFDRLPDAVPIAYELCDGCVKPSECYSSRRCRFMLSRALRGKPK
jgi:hypothetical protein